MAIVIASNLRKDIAGEPLYDNVTFRLERRNRLALSGRNGAGKTTLLRVLAGETQSDGGELAFEKSTKDRTPRSETPIEADLTLREYVLSARTESDLARAGVLEAGTRDVSRRS